MLEIKISNNRIISGVNNHKVNEMWFLNFLIQKDIIYLDNTMLKVRIIEMGMHEVF